MIVKRGDMFYADLSPVVGSEQRRNWTRKFTIKNRINSANRANTNNR